MKKYQTGDPDLVDASQAILDPAEQRIRESGGISHEDLWGQVDEEKWGQEGVFCGAKSQ